MAYVYRYTDMADGIIKYVGIVWGNNRSLSQRIKEHKKNDLWCKCRDWKIEFLKKTITNRTDAEYLEAHYISLFNTGEYYNVKKVGWGISEFLSDEGEWVEYSPSTATDERIFDKLLAVIEEKDAEIANLHHIISTLQGKVIVTQGQIDEALSKHCRIL